MQRKFTDDEIIEALKGGLEERNLAISDLWYDDKFREKAINTLFKFCLNGNIPTNLETIDDTLRDSILIFAENVHKGKFKEKSSITTFIIGIGKNLCLKHRDKQNSLKKRERTYTKHMERFGDQFSEMKSPDLTQEELLDRMIFQLDEKCQNILKDKFARKSIKESVSRLNLKEQTIKNYRTTCWDKLIKLIRRDSEILELLKSYL
jgi:hypothetical protein